MSKEKCYHGHVGLPADPQLHSNNEGIRNKSHLNNQW